MHGVLPAEAAIFLCFHTIRMILFLLGRIVITLFTFCTSQCYPDAHNFHLTLFCRRTSSVFRTARITNAVRKSTHKKKACASKRLSILTQASGCVKTIFYRKARFRLLFTAPSPHAAGQPRIRDFYSRFLSAKPTPHRLQSVMADWLFSLSRDSQSSFRISPSTRAAQASRSARETAPSSTAFCTRSGNPHPIFTSLPAKISL